jgi:hypothetical protein
MLLRLRAQAGEEEIQVANNCLRNRVEPEVLDWLPTELLNNRQTPELLHSLQLVEGSALHEWKVGVDEALEAPQMPEAEAREEAQALTLPSRIGQMTDL